MNLIFGIFKKKLILKHFMHRTISKRCVLGVFWTVQYVFEVNFTWRGFLLTFLTSFYGYHAFGCIYIFTHTQKKKNSIHQLLYFRDMFLNGISLNFCKKPRIIHFDLKSVFSLSCKISSADLYTHAKNHLASTRKSYAIKIDRPIRFSTYRQVLFTWLYLNK